MHNLNKKMKNLQSALAPRTSWVEATRSLLMQKMSAEKSMSSANFGRFLLHVPALYPAVAMMAGFAMVFLGTGAFSVNAAMRSLPGSILYPVKRQVEKIELSVTPGAVAKTEINLNLATRRLDEMGQLAQTSSNVASIKQNLQDFKVNLEHAVDKVQNQMPTEKAVEFARKIESATKGYDQKLASTENALPNDLQREMREAHRTVKMSALSAVETLAQNTDESPVVELRVKQELKTTKTNMIDVEQQVKDVKVQDTVIFAKGVLKQAKGSMQKAEEYTQKREFNNAAKVMKWNTELISVIDDSIQDTTQSNQEVQK